jgi:hypothetical protein
MIWKAVLFERLTIYLIHHGTAKLTLLKRIPYLTRPAHSHDDDAKLMPLERKIQ